MTALLGATFRRALSAPAAFAPAGIPANVLTTIHQRVYFVNNVASRGGPYAQYKDLRSFPELAASCRLWREQGFGGITDLSREVGRYARETVPTLYPQLAAAITGKNRGQIAAIVSQLKEHAAAVASRATQVASIVTRFYQANDAFDKDLLKLPQTDWLTLFTKPKDVDTAVAQLRGTWGAIAYDLGEVEEAILSHSIDALKPADVDVAAESWTDPAEKAKVFDRTAEEQRRVMDGLFVGPLGGATLYQREERLYFLIQEKQPFTTGDRVILFGAAQFSGRGTIADVKSPADLHTKLWGYAIQAKAAPKGDGWVQLPGGGTWMRSPVIFRGGAFGFTAVTADSVRRGADGRILVRAAKEPVLNPGEFVGVMVFGRSYTGTIDARAEVTNDAGDRFWEYTLPAQPISREERPVWGGMYRDDS